MARISVDGEKDFLDKEYKVLDKGFVRLVDYLGDDSRIVSSARVSYGNGTKSYREDKGLINYLLRNEHTSPFEQVSFTFHIKMPIFVARQWIRHRTAKVNEISGRYSILKDEYYVPDLDKLNIQSIDNKQGRSKDLVQNPEAVRALIIKQQEESTKRYKELLDTGLAREIARINLPLSIYTEWYWTMDLHNLLHFLKLRLDNHAQYEIRVYAQTILDIVSKICPITVDAFENHIRESIKLNKVELDAIKALLKNKKPNLSEREKQLLEEKLSLEL